MGYPDTAEQRKAGMAMMRARMLAAHERQLEKPLSTADRKAQEWAVATIKAAQTAKGE